jgi:hypothetical protein
VRRGMLVSAMRSRAPPSSLLRALVGTFRQTDGRARKADPAVYVLPSVTDPGKPSKARSEGVVRSGVHLIARPRNPGTGHQRGRSNHEAAANSVV